MNKFLILLILLGLSSCGANTFKIKESVHKKFPKAIMVTAPVFDPQKFIVIDKDSTLWVVYNPKLCRGNISYP